MKRAHGLTALFKKHTSATRPSSTDTSQEVRDKLAMSRWSMLHSAIKRTPRTHLGTGRRRCTTLKSLNRCTPSNGARALDMQGALRGAERMGSTRFQKKTKIAEPSTTIFAQRCAAFTTSLNS